MGILLALLLAADPSTGSGVPLEDPPPPKRFELSVGFGVDAQPQGAIWIANIVVWADLELTWRLLPWLRLGLLSGGGWSEERLPAYPGQHGAFRLLANAEVVFPNSWGEFFAGVAGGLHHTNLYYDDLDHVPSGYSSSWQPGGALVVRAGVAFRSRDRIGFGFTLGYCFFRAGFVEVRHSVELHGRVSFHF